MLNNNRVQRYNKKMTLKREKTKKSQMPEGRWDFYINMLYSAKKYRTKKSVRLLSCRSLLLSRSSINSRSLLYCRSSNRSIFCYNDNRNLDFNLLVEVNSCLVLTNLLGILHSDDLTIYLDTLLCELLSYSSGVNRTIKLTCCAHLSGNSKNYVIESLTLLNSLSLDSLELVSLLLQILSQLLFSRY